MTALHTYDAGRIDPDAAARDEVFRWRNLAVGGRFFAVPVDQPVLLEVNTGLSYAANAAGSTARPERSSDALQVSTELNLTYFRRAARIGGGVFMRANRYGYALGDGFVGVETRESLLVTAGAYLESSVPLGGGAEAEPGVVLALDPVRNAPRLEPRLRLAWRPGGEDGRQTVSAAFGLYRQTVAGLTDTRDAGSAFVAWVPAPVAGAEPRAAHALAGWEGRPARGLSFGAEVYHKRLRDHVVPAWSAVARFTTALAVADGRSYGLDLRTELRRPAFYAYVGYGLARTVYEAAGADLGRWFGVPVRRYAPPHDRRHQLNAVLSRRLGRFEADARWAFGSGLPYTQSLGFDEVLPLERLVDVRRVFGTSRVLYEAPYGARLPAYHRLDVSLARPFDLPHSRLTVQGGVINAYDRPNLFYLDLYTLRRIDQLPLLPYLSLKLETR